MLAAAPLLGLLFDERVTISPQSSIRRTRTGEEGAMREMETW